MIRKHTQTRTRRNDRGTTPTPGTEGLDALDRERAASLADEGGASAARVERPERTIPRRANRDDEPLSKRRWIFVPF